jgi:hypothetical protein
MYRNPRKPEQQDFRKTPVPEFASQIQTAPRRQVIDITACCKVFDGGLHCVESSGGGQTSGGEKYARNPSENESG